GRSICRPQIGKFAQKNRAIGTIARLIATPGHNEANFWIVAFFDRIDRVLQSFAFPACASEKNRYFIATESNLSPRLGTQLGFVAELLKWNAVVDDVDFVSPVIVKIDDLVL